MEFKVLAFNNPESASKAIVSSFSFCTLRTASRTRKRRASEPNRY